MLENKRLDIMGFVASLDMGSEKMVMALGEKSGSDCRLVGVISIASQGVKRGKIIDKLRAKACLFHFARTSRVILNKQTRIATDLS